MLYEVITIPIRFARYRWRMPTFILIWIPPDDYFSGCIRFGRRGVPTMAEAKAILDHIYSMPEKGLAHGRMVGDVAGILCQTSYNFV